MTTKDEPYFIEVDTNGCAHCGHGRTWIVVGPDDVGSSTSFDDKEDAAALADSLNAAYFAGQTAARKATP